MKIATLILLVAAACLVALLAYNYNENHKELTELRWQFFVAHGRS